MQLAGISPSPAVMTDERGNLVIFQAISGHWMERLERAAAVEFGGAASSTEFSLTASQAREATVRNSVSLAIRIGEAAIGAAVSPIAALIAEIGAFRLRHREGLGRGAAHHEWLRPRLGGDRRARRGRGPPDPAGTAEREPGRAGAGPGAGLGAGSDSVLDVETADAIATERIKYGQRVVVIAFACDPVWRTERGVSITRPPRVRLRL